MSESLTSEEVAHLLKIRVCGCDGSCDTSNHCPQPVLDGIGADWIANHFEQLAETLVRADRNARFVEKVREAFDSARSTSWFCEDVKSAHFEIYHAPCKPVRE